MVDDYERRRPEDLATLLALAGGAACLVFEVGGLVAPIVLILVAFAFQVPSQRKHNARRREAITEFRELRSGLSDAEREQRLQEIRHLYGKNHGAVRQLAAEEEEERGNHDR